MSELFIFSTPDEAAVTLTLDSAIVIKGEAASKNGRDAHLLKIPSGTPGQGALLKVSSEGHSPFQVRGLLVTPATGDAQFVLDDVRLVKNAPPPGPSPQRPGPTRPVSASKDPLTIINEVFATGQHSLATKEGCGRFTEACCAALHEINALWGHIRKVGAQNQFNGHAVDAIQLLAGEGNGIFDIIFNSESPNAEPSFNRKGDPEPSLFFFPA
jgi:hypothetical protein